MYNEKISGTNTLMNLLADLFWQCTQIFVISMILQYLKFQNFKKACPLKPLNVLFSTPDFSPNNSPGLGSLQLVWVLLFLWSSVLCFSNIQQAKFRILSVSWQYLCCSPRPYPHSNSCWYFTFISISYSHPENW